ncbi:bifunctional methylenetetrahydrofolate dehydrogenase/methenyltetrahydrofolate cyclohydrolase FolD [Campylobacter hominis]|uniref:Bifunctional protein FolD n=1 Tax=Campylobacter hominis (strain ATCC BAA-381 / DSM 21671 / CCUG 45161 / LMG 19568 / NCTC 13146 / CH001A) TaxID=360107 RepID=FOLD_CAMHC|nr:bifunctional methylenetetrahydrofolate dehydrogenase/methenyltetrahydrofolate cyclohydrolase FolD [Campylobacter hominis]A7I254.1 RecName: Full=Bifunctional protein FolD; Includes: RecName: Full=Methylenetetrahydrofolate dehydrogenase; Includes: RecName: Full=Methenyltetrahydrofolate cyclohydrolase [Campylobacter hominis ATCC BAA-381]ABS52171.1 bifunctional protein FolD [Campylobacter hominis ATCC BAA-381]UAK86134.1 bifunctional methylenetetrahydrofolate dehydrogenase/methenyltetrahydrofolate
MQLIDGKAISAKVKEEVKNEAAQLTEKGVVPCLAVILVGDDKASQTYVNSKEKACKACGIRSLKYTLEANTSESALIDLIQSLNENDEVDGILVQLPLPKHIDENKILEKISCEKDVDGFHAVNVGRLVSGLDGFVPCTPCGIMRLFKEYDIEISGKNAVVIGRSNIVGKPMANLLLNANATVTVTHSKTQNLAKITKDADIIVVAIGKPNFLKADMVKNGAVVIDVGINRLENNKLVGDADFENVANKCSFITPVPGGVGPMTIAMLLKNTIKSAKNRLKRLK